MLGRKMELMPAVVGLLLSLPAQAIDWDVNAKDTKKYFNDAEQFNEYYLEQTTSIPDSWQLSFAKAELGFEKNGIKFNIPCFRVTEIESAPGLLNSKGSINSYYINLSKLKKVQSGGLAKYQNEEYAKEYITLNDGKKFEIVAFTDRGIKACGISQNGDLFVLPLKWKVFTKTQKSGTGRCGIDESKVKNWPDMGSLDGVSEFSNNGSTNEEYIGFNFARTSNWKTEYSHDQNKLRETIATCENASHKLAELETKRRDAEAIKVAEWQKQQEKETQRRLEETKKAQDMLTAEAMTLRKTIKIGTLTNCGPVFDIRLPMVGVQTMNGMQFININQLWGPSASCHFKNGVYAGPNP